MPFSRSEANHRIGLKEITNLSPGRIIISKDDFFSEFLTKMAILYPNATLSLSGKISTPWTRAFGDSSLKAGLSIQSRLAQNQIDLVMTEFQDSILHVVLKNFNQATFIFPAGSRFPLGTLYCYKEPLLGTALLDFTRDLFIDSTEKPFIMTKEEYPDLGPSFDAIAILISGGLNRIYYPDQTINPFELPKGPERKRPDRLVGVQSEPVGLVEFEGQNLDNMLLTATPKLVLPKNTALIIACGMTKKGTRIEHAESRLLMAESSRTGQKYAHQIIAETHGPIRPDYILVYGFNNCQRV